MEELINGLVDGPYYLERNVKNPSPDGRRKGDWSSGKVIPKGTIVLVSIWDSPHKSIVLNGQNVTVERACREITMAGGRGGFYPVHAREYARHGKVPPERTGNELAWALLPHLKPIAFDARGLPGWLYYWKHGWLTSRVDADDILLALVRAGLLTPAQVRAGVTLAQEELEREAEAENGPAK